jgi:hypothetical protein
MEEMKENIRLKELKGNFVTIYQKSPDKAALLEREIEGYSLIFDENKLQLSVLSNDDEPLVKYTIPYSSMQLFLIREFYIHFRIYGSDLSELEKDDWNTWVRDMNEFALKNLSELDGPKYYYNLARDLNEYVKWLKNYSIQNSEPIIPDEYIGLIFDEFKDHFNKETKSHWTERFRYPSTIPIEPILACREAREGSDRLVLIAILAAIQKETGNKFSYNKFVFERFGIKAFEKMKSDHQKKQTYTVTSEKCNAILKK